MRTSPRRLARVAAAAALAAALGGCARATQTPPAGSAPGPDPGFDVQRLGDGVYALVRHDPEAFANNANSLIVVGDSGVLVVDAQYTRAATAQTLGAVRRLTNRPVRYVVNTHWHDDHVAGNQVYRDTFPDVAFVAHENTRRDLATLGASNRRATLGVAPSYVARLRRLIDAGLGADSTPIMPLERAALESTIAITTQYVAEAPGFRETLPTRTFSRALTLDLGARRVEVRYFGRGNTAGDAVVSVPDQRVVATGDLLVAPAPFAFNAYPGEWADVLDSVAALGPSAMVPGHGPVLRGDAYLRLVQRMLRRVRDETRAAAARGATLAQAREAVTLADVRDSVARGDKWRATLFTTMFLRPTVARAYDEATGKP